MKTHNDLLQEMRQFSIPFRKIRPGNFPLSFIEGYPIVMERAEMELLKKANSLFVESRDLLDIDEVRIREGLLEICDEAVRELVLEASSYFYR